MSTLDVTGKGLFTVVTGLAGSAWKDAVRRLNLPFLRIVVTGSPDAQDLYCECSASATSKRPERCLCDPTGW